MGQLDSTAVQPHREVHLVVAAQHVDPRESKSLKPGDDTFSGSRVESPNLARFQALRVNWIQQLYSCNSPTL
jgi:hypothetical protein